MALTTPLQTGLPAQASMALRNPKHEHFAQLLATGVSATEAARVVGYSAKRAAVTGSELGKNRKVAARVAELREMVTALVVEKAAVDKAWVIAELVDNVKMAKQATPVLDNEGKPAGQYQQNLSAANKALELIGKELGMFVDSKEIRTGPLTSLSDEQLERLIVALDAELPANAFELFGRPIKH